MVASAENKPTQRIRLLSSQYVRTRGQIVISCGGQSESVRFPDGRGVEASCEGASNAPLLFNDGLSDEVVISGPGLYFVMLTDVQAAKARNGEEVFLGDILVGEVQITETELSSGMITLDPGPLGALHVLVVDKWSRPEPGTNVSMFFLPQRSITQEFHTDKTGEFTVPALRAGKYRVWVSSDRHEVEVRANEQASVTLIAPENPKSSRL